MTKPSELLNSRFLEQRTLYILLAILIPALPLVALLRPELIDISTVLPLIPLAIIYLVVLWRSPVIGVWVLIFWVPLQYWITKDLGILPESFVLIDEFTMVVLTGVWLLRRWFSGKRIWTSTPLDVPFFLFVIVALLSVVLNHINWFKGLFAIRQLIQYALAYYVIVNLGLPERTLKKLIFATIAIGLFQVPLSILQFLSRFQEVLAREQTGLDVVTGTMGSGGSNTMGYFALLVIGLLVGLMRYERRKYRSFVAFFAIFLLCIPIILSGSRICLIILPIFLLWLFARTLLKRPLLLIGIGIAALLVIYGSIYMVRDVLDEWRLTFSPEVNIQAEQDITNVGRIGFLPIAWDVLREQSASALIGTGPSSFTSLAGQRFESPLFIAYHFRGTEAAGVSSQIIATGVEYGYLGMLLFIAIIVVFWRLSRAAVKSLTNPFWRGIAEGYFMGILLFTIPTPFVNIWEIQYFSFYIWLIPGILVSLMLRSAQQGVEQESTGS